MSTIILKNNTVLNERTGNNLKDRIRDYFYRNRNFIILGLYTVNGKMPSLQALRAMKIL